MITLRNWHLRRFAAHGVVLGHPRLPDGMHVHTSPIQEMVLLEEEDSLVLETASGNLYCLEGRDIARPFRLVFENSDTLKETQRCLDCFGVSPECAARFQLLREAAEQETLRQAERELAPGELLLETAGTFVLRALFRTEEGETRAVEPTIHSGMFQDSVLVTDWEGGRVDFRYFPIWDRLEPYHTSDGLTAIHLRNLGRTDLKFGSERAPVLCPAGETTVIPMADHPAEGLISPDAVNGKSLLTGAGRKKPGKGKRTVKKD